MKKAWYKQFWPWFVIALPASAVVASLTTVTIFAKNSVDLVAEDYYKKGKAINVDLTRITLAEKQHIKAWFSFDEHKGIVKLDKGYLDALPTLRVTLTHRTLPNQDQQIMVNPDAQGNYRFTTHSPLTGPWFVEIEPHDATWMLQSRLNFPAVEAPLHEDAS